MRHIAAQLRGLYFGLLVLFVCSCNDDNLIGLQTTASPLLGQYCDTLDVEISYEKDSEFTTSGSSSLPLGYFKDPFMGLTEASIAAQVGTPWSNLVFPTMVDNQLDSVVLVLKLGKQFYGDSITIGAKPKVSVYELKQELSVTSTVVYRNSDTWGTYSDGERLNEGDGEVGFYSGGFTVSDTITEVTATTTFNNTVTYPELRIRLNTNQFYKKFVTASSAYFASSADFKAYFKGLFIKMDASALAVGSIAHIDLSGSDNCKLELYYHYLSNGVSTASKTTFPMGSSAGRVAAQVTHDYAGYPAGAHLNDINATEIYLQPMGGLRARVKFPNLTATLNSLTGNDLTKISINKATIYLPRELGSEYDTNITGLVYTPTARLTAYSWDATHTRAYIPDNYTSSSAYLGDAVFDGRLGNQKADFYAIGLTGFLQQLLVKDKVYGDMLFVAPTDPSTSSYAGLNPTLVNAHRTVISNNSMGAKPILQIYYTRVTK